MNIYFQKAGKEFVDDWVYAAWQGFYGKEEHRLLFFEEMDERIPLNKNTMVIGFIEDTKKFFEMINWNVPKPLGVPDELKNYTKRKMEIKTLGEFKKETGVPIFVKPYDTIKTIPSGVIKMESSRRTLLGEYDDNLLVQTSEVIDMVSEYRCFVRRGKIIGIKHYQGDYKIFPDIKVIEEMNQKYKGPIAHSIDVAVTDKNETVLVEVQDAWSIGHYGLGSELYAGFLMDRWIEIQNKNKEVFISTSSHS